MTKSKPQRNWKTQNAHEQKPVSLYILMYYQLSLQLQRTIITCSHFLDYMWAYIIECKDTM